VAIGRALLIAAIAIAASGHLSPWLAGQSGRARTMAWGLLLAPFFTPALLISYTFAQFALALVVAPWSRETLYIGVLALKLTPVAVILRTYLRSPLSPQAWQIYRQHGHGSRWERLKFYLHGAGRGPWIAGGVVFLIAFADFELASLWYIRTWTVAIFDAQIGGLALSETLRLAAAPLIVALGVVAGVAWQSKGLSWSRPENAQSRVRWPWWYLGATALLVSLAPLVLIFGQAVAGFPSLLTNFVLGPEIGTSLFLAFAAAILADITIRISRRRKLATLLAVAPGLLGALTISLLVLALFQLPGFRSAYDTPIPLVITLAILLFPLGLLLSAIRAPHTPAMHIARQSGSWRLRWELETRPHMIACALLFCWAYFDFTASSILAPVGFTPVFVRLHNLAHYGQTAVLSAMMIAAFIAPILVLLLTGTTLHLYARRDGR
jgi:hypothetical protein